MKKSSFEHFMRKVNRNASGILSVAPMRGKYVWLNEELETPSRGTITFEAKGSNDICVCLHPDSNSTVVGRDGLAAGSPAYEILFGGWSNSKSAIRKHGIQQRVVTKTDKQEAVIRTTNVFSSYWITIYDDWVYAGAGELGCNEILRWQDPTPTGSIKCIGLSSWNTPLQFKNILVGPPFIPKIHTYEMNGSVLCGSETLSDGDLIVENTTIPIHKAILHCWQEALVPQSYDLQEVAKNEEPESPELTKKKEKEASNSDSGEIPHENSLESSNHENEKEDSLKQEKVNPLESLPYILAKKVLQFLYTGSVGDVSSEQLVQLMNFAMKQSLTPLLAHLQSKASNEMQTKPSVETIIKTVVRYKELFRKELYSDVTIVCDGDSPDSPLKQFPAHKIILALWSEPFRAMFTSQMRESLQKEIYLPEVNDRAFKLFLEFCYTGDVVIPPDRCIPILMLADRFGITPLQEKCCEFVVKFIDLDNCCALLEMAAMYNWETLRAHCMRFIETNFKTLVNHSDDFLEMSPDVLLELILSDDLMVSDEYEVYHSVIKWSEHQFPLGDESSPTNHQLLADLMCCIRFPLLSESFLIDTVSNHFLHKRSARFRSQIERTLEYLCTIEDHGSPPTGHIANSEVLSKENLLDNYTKRPRNVYNHHQLLFSHCGDQNGVCYFLGCNYGKNSIWQNPHKARRLTVTLSCPTNRYSRPELFVGRSYSTTNYATGNPPWCMIDFGEGHELVCNHYTMRLDSSQSYLQNWILQASVDISSNDSWVNLRVHQDEPQFLQSDWAVFGKSARHPYRYFRILACAPTKTLGISSIEFYGYFK